MKARGTGVVAKVDVIKDNTVVYSTSPGQQKVNFEFMDKGPVAGRHFYYVRLMQADGMIAWTSPFFVNYGNRVRASRRKHCLASLCRF